MVQEKGLEPSLGKELDPKSSASANFATPAKNIYCNYINAIICMQLQYILIFLFVNQNEQINPLNRLFIQNAV